MIGASPSLEKYCSPFIVPPFSQPSIPPLTPSNISGILPSFLALPVTRDCHRTTGVLAGSAMLVIYSELQSFLSIS